MPVSSFRPNRSRSSSRPISASTERSAAARRRTAGWHTTRVQPQPPARLERARLRRGAALDWIQPHVNQEDQRMGLAAARAAAGRRRGCAGPAR